MAERPLPAHGAPSAPLPRAVGAPCARPWTHACSVLSFLAARSSALSLRCTLLPSFLCRDLVEFHPCFLLPASCLFLGHLLYCAPGCDEFGSDSFPAARSSFPSVAPFSSARTSPWRFLTAPSAVKTLCSPCRFPLRQLSRRPFPCTLCPARFAMPHRVPAPSL
ncbi:uncharacterized protein [Zea mays]|jgi:hypothetical protein|uniref:uncharacterized protein n=1 Tax=Zea mays TaxID=4577 RepID=UPI0002208E61|nr:uncharacterized protein LOC103629074 [Zea mays]|eukprot:XP_020395321.1 uncharacterized protein LOC103629074 [Zea mays]